MTISWKKSANLSLFFALALLMLCASPAFARRDAGSKARGDSEPFFGPVENNARTYTYYNNTANNNMASNARRSFSYAPSSFQAGDKVEVSAADAKVMRGDDTVGTLHHGDTFTVTKVIGSWLGVSTKDMSGWVFTGNVMAEGSAANPPAAPQAQRRSYSYEPSTQTYNSNRFYYSEPAKEPWQYPKTDPRRFRVYGH